MDQTEKLNMSDALRECAEYIERFAKAQNKTTDEVIDYAAVRMFKEYKEKSNGTTTKDSIKS